jgi:hypothetical protein
MATQSLLKKAENKMAFFKCGILGFPGSGKTYTASLLAIGICKATKNNKVAFFDTETGSDFMLVKLQAEGLEVFQVKSRSFKDCVQTVEECEEQGIGVLIIDSITHVWRDLCDSYDAKLHRNGRLQFQDWNVIKMEWRHYSDAFVNSKVHVIVCGRAGYDYDYDFNEDGSKDLIKTATKMKVETEFAFEPSLIIEMERTTEDRDAIKEHMGKTDAKNKAAKLQHKPEVGSQAIHRAYVLKDRTDRLDGQVFDNPTFEDFLPHFQALNIGGEHLGVDTTRNSEGLFDIQGKTVWQKEAESKEIALEEIKAEVDKVLPGSTAKEKQAKIHLSEHVFGTASGTALEKKKADELREGLKRIRVILGVPENTLENMAAGKIIERDRRSNRNEDRGSQVRTSQAGGASVFHEDESAVRTVNLLREAGVGRKEERRC